MSFHCNCSHGNPFQWFITEIFVPRFSKAKASWQKKNEKPTQIALHTGLKRSKLTAAHRTEAWCAKVLCALISETCFRHNCSCTSTMPHSVYAMRQQTQLQLSFLFSQCFAFPTWIALNGYWWGLRCHMTVVPNGWSVLLRSTTSFVQNQTTQMGLPLSKHKSKLVFIWSILKTAFQLSILLCYSACLIQNSPKLKNFHSVLFVWIKRDPPVDREPLIQF